MRPDRDRNTRISTKLSSGHDICLDSVATTDTVEVDRMNGHNSRQLFCQLPSNHPKI